MKMIFENMFKFYCLKHHKKGGLLNPSSTHPLYNF